MKDKSPSRNYQYETQRFLLRQVQAEDAPALLKCYGNPAAVALMNDDNCLRGFLCQTLEDMQAYISIWQSEDYARLAVIDKKSREPVGTLEIFGGETGVLRVDLRPDYETPEVLEELYTLAKHQFPEDFPMGAMVTKAVPQAAARREALIKLGFSGPETFRNYDSYYRLPVRTLGIAYCGLACCLCSQKESCPGCQNQGCEQSDKCVHFACCREKGLAGCWECPDFPCGQGMQKNRRILTFAKFAKVHGVARLLECLERNRWAGVVYHQPGGLTGDYDLETEEEIMRLLEKGK